MIVSRGYFGAVCPYCSTQPHDLAMGEKEAIPGYQILELVGRGGMGVVFKATQKSLGRLVALKTVFASQSADRTMISRFEQEAATIARLAHPNIVSALDFGRHQGGLWQADPVMVPGESQVRLFDGINLLTPGLTQRAGGWSARDGRLVHITGTAGIFQVNLPDRDDWLFETVAENIEYNRMEIQFGSKVTESNSPRFSLRIENGRASLGRLDSEEGKFMASSEPMDLDVTRELHFVSVAKKNGLYEVSIDGMRPGTVSAGPGRASIGMSCWFPVAIPNQMKTVNRTRVSRDWWPVSWSRPVEGHALGKSHFSSSSASARSFARPVDRLFFSNILGEITGI